jgi:hypothetical protein
MSLDYSFLIFVRVKELLTVITIIKVAPVQTEMVLCFIPEHVTVGGTGGRHVERRQLLERWSGRVCPFFL